MVFGGIGMISIIDLHLDVALLSETHLKPHGRLFIPNYHFYLTDSFPGRKGGIAIAVIQGIPHCHVQLPPLVSIESTGFYSQQSTCHHAMPGMMQTSLNS
jgi:hypothetical protein